MPQVIVLPPGVALGIIAFLLSLLPAGFFMWLWYLRHHERSIKSSVIALAFLVGMLLVIPSFRLEDLAYRAWQTFWPQTSHYFAGAVLPITSWWDILLPALGTFAVVAVIEEGLRYMLMRVWLRRSKTVNQVFDGLLIGLAIGLGFATLENTMYFLDQFRQGSYDTLVFIFFLRFLISTLAHISFAGLMGTLIAQGVFSIFSPRSYYLSAFFVPWFLHGLYDLLLGIGHGFYAVMLLVPPLLVFVYWTQRRDFFIIHRKDGKLLVAAEAPQTTEMKAVQKVLKTEDSPWNKGAPWLSQSKSYRRITDAFADGQS